MWKIITALASIGKIIDLVKTFAAMISEYFRKRKVEQQKEAIDEAVKTGDQRPMEEALGHPNPGAPSEHRGGVQTRPSRDRSGS